MPSRQPTFGSVSELQALRDIVGDAHVVTDPEVTAGYALDWTGRFRGSTPAVVRPGTTEEVAAVVRICAAAGLAIVPQGGNTGLVAGGVPLHGEVIVSLARLTRSATWTGPARQVTAAPA